MRILVINGILRTFNNRMHKTYMILLSRIIEPLANHSKINLANPKRSINILIRNANIVGTKYVSYIEILDTIVTR